MKEYNKLIKSSIRSKAYETAIEICTKLGLLDRAARIKIDQLFELQEYSAANQVAIEKFQCDYISRKYFHSYLFQSPTDPLRLGDVDLMQKIGNYDGVLVTLNSVESVRYYSDIFWIISEVWTKAEHPEIAIQVLLKIKSDGALVLAEKIADNTGSYNAIIKFYERNKMYGEQAACLEKIGKHGDACKLYEKIGKFDLAYEAAKKSGLRDKVEYYHRLCKKTKE
jgi:hypothetical protein